MALSTTEGLAACRPPSLKLNRRTSAYDIHTWMRAEIMSGRIPPGTELAQAKVAREIGVSRTPVREAMRMLQNEGLLSAEPNDRMRVRGFDLSELDSVYAARVLLESLAVKLSVERISGADLKEMEDCVDKMSQEECWLDFDRFLHEHRRFHSLLVRHSGAALTEEIRAFSERSTRFQYLHSDAQDLDHWQDDVAHHVEIIAACRARDGAWAARLVSRHLAQKAFALFETHAGAGGQQPHAVRSALMMVLSDSRGSAKTEGSAQ